MKNICKNKHERKTKQHQHCKQKLKRTKITNNKQIYFSKIQIYFYTKNKKTKI
jgi:uncharacterized membrane protein YcaP (DUF421 family)